MEVSSFKNDVTTKICNFEITSLRNYEMLKLLNHINKEYCTYEIAWKKKLSPSKLRNKVVELNLQKGKI